MWRYARWRHWKCGYTQLEAATINHLHAPLQPSCSGVLVSNTIAAAIVIDIKIVTVTFSVLQFQQPSYLSSLIPRYAPTRTLRSSSSLSVCVPPRRTTMATSKSFSSVASNIWNAILNHMSSIQTLPAFRRVFKHHLFLLAYPDSSAKSGKIKPAQGITLCDTAPTTDIAEPGNTTPPSLSYVIVWAVARFFGAKIAIIYCLGPLTMQMQSWDLP